jgi:hypothetical protein
MIRPGTKAFDAPASKRDVIIGIAAEVAKKINIARTVKPDPDDASEMGGTLFRKYIEELAYDPSFVREVNQQVGGDNFNSELFLDGLFGEGND